MMLLACAASSASATSVAISRRRSISTGVPLMTCLSVAPSMNSMTMKARPASFALEALEGLRILGHIVGKKFERDEPAEAGVLGFVHHTHAAATQFFLDTVVGDGFVDHAGGWLSFGDARD